MDAAHEKSENRKSPAVRISERAMEQTKMYDPSNKHGSRFQRDTTTSTSGQPTPSSTATARPTTSSAATTRAQQQHSHNHHNHSLILPERGVTRASRVGTASDPVVFDYNSVRSWTVKDVGNFFKRYFPSVVECFMLNEVDGLALLLITNDDLVNRFNLKFGPALKLYELIGILLTGDENVINRVLERLFNDDEDTM